MKALLTTALLVLLLAAHAQVKIGNNPGTINSNSLLEMESTNKGFLPPRVALNSLSSVSPLSGTVPAGMLVYSAGGTLIDGYYYWNGTAWVMFAAGRANIVTKTANATLTKTETFVLASNNITLTLPVVTSADDGLSITIKNMGIHTDLVVVMGNGAAVIDNGAIIALPRWFSLTMTAYGGNWVFKERTTVAANTLEVSPYGSWQTLQEALEFLNLHAWGPTVIKLGSGSFDVSATQVINLPFSLTIEGTSYGTTTIAAASGLANKPMFRCISDCSFKKLVFDATTLTGYGTQPGEDAIRLAGTGTYHEIKDCSIDRFYNAILDSSDAELWLFECDITNAQANGLLVQSNMDSVVIKVAETDFIHCKLGIDLENGDEATVQISSAGFYNATSSDTAIAYTPATFTAIRDIHITGNSWNNIGKFIDGFDFTRADGRDASAFIENNAGDGDHNPSCKISVNNNVSTTTVTTSGTWVKANWTNTSSVTTKWTIGNNKITYQSANRRNAFVIITGNISIGSANKTVSIGIVKNGIATTRIGETDLRLTTGSQPYQFSTVVYLSDIGPGDYFELYCTSSSNGDVVTFLDVQWLTVTQ